MNRRFLPQFLLVLISLVVMGRIAGHEFINWDDPYTIANPPPLLQTVSHGYMGLWIPLTYAVWRVLALISFIGGGSGANPWIFHSTSIALHAINVLLVFRILSKLSPETTWPAFFGALVFAIHPLQVETIAWASGLKDVLAATLALVAIERYLARSQLLALLAFALSMLAKPSSVVAIPIVLILDWLMSRRLNKSLIVWVAIAIPITIVARFAQSTVGVPTIPLHLRPLVAGDAIAFYLWKLVWPVKLAPDYGHLANSISHWTWLIPICLALLLVRAPRRIQAGAVIFVIALAPVLSFTPFLFQFYSTVADHYMYLPMLGVALAVAAIPIRPICWTPVVAMLCALSFIQAGYWRDSESIFRHTLVVNNRSNVAENNLGAALAEQGRYAEAIEHYNRALAIAPNYRMAHTNLAQLYALMNEPDLAIEHLEKALELWDQTPAGLGPRDSRAEHLLLAEILDKRGRHNEAEIHRRKAQSQ